MQSKATDFPKRTGYERQSIAESASFDGNGPAPQPRFDKRTDGERVRAHDHRTWWRMQIRRIALAIKELGGERRHDPFPRIV
jgi:hypothetical protein